MVRGNREFLDGATNQELASEMIGQGRRLIGSALAVSGLTAVAILQSRGLLPNTPAETGGVFVGVVGGSGSASYYCVRWMGAQIALEGRLRDAPVAEGTNQNEWRYPYESL